MRAIALSVAILCGCGGAVNGFSAEPVFNVCYFDGGKPVNVQAQTTNPWILTTPRIRIIFWGNWWLTNGSNQYQQMSQEWITIGNDPNFYQPLAVYDIKPGTLEGIYSTNWNVPLGNLSENYIQTELQTEISNGALPASDLNSLYVIMLPQGTQAQADIDGKFVGRHARVKDIAYAYAEYNSEFQVMSMAVAHEVYEGITDPNDGAGFVNGHTNEIADLCGGSPVWYLEGYPVVKIWNQQNCACAP